MPTNLPSYHCLTASITGCLISCQTDTLNSRVSLTGHLKTTLSSRPQLFKIIPYGCSQAQVSLRPCIDCRNQLNQTRVWNESLGCYLHRYLVNVCTCPTSGGQVCPDCICPSHSECPWFVWWNPMDSDPRPHHFPAYICIVSVVFFFVTQGRGANWKQWSQD